MKKIAGLLIALFGLVFFSSSQAVVIIANEHETLEGARIEILHNIETNAGTVIVHKADCSGCAPLTLNYQGDFLFSINGYSEPFTPESPSIGQGDVSYKPDDMSVGHINLYQ